MAGWKIQDYAPRGLVQDVPPYAVDPSAWTAMQNMRTAGAGAERCAGQVELAGPLSIVPRWAMAALRGGEVWLLYAGAAGVYATNGASHYDVTPTSGWSDFLAGTITSGTLNDVPCFNAPNRAPWYWDLGLVPGSVKPMPGFLAGATARTFGVFGQHAFVGSVTDAATRYARLAWSDVAGPGTVPASWVPTALNQAGDMDLAVGAGQIQMIRGLGQQLMVYRTSGCFAVQYVGRPYIYQARPISAQIGAASQNAVAEVRGTHVLISPGDIVIADGTTVRSIGQERVKRTIFSQLSEEGLRVSHCFAVPGAGEVVFMFALGNDLACNIAYVWSYSRDECTVRDVPDTVHGFATFVPAVVDNLTWDNDAGPWETDFKPWDAGNQSGFSPRSLGVSEANNALVLLDWGDVDLAGNVIKGSVERLSLPLGSPDTVKLATRIYPRINGTPGTRLTVQVGAQIGPADSVLWGQPAPFIVGETIQVDCLAVGRYLSVRVEGESISPWAVSGFAVQYSERSRS